MLTWNVRGEADVWQKRSREHTIRDENDLARHVDYIHYNPVKNGFVARAADWPHYSLHHFIEHGLLTSDWGFDGPWPTGELGER